MLPVSQHLVLQVLAQHHLWLYASVVQLQNGVGLLVYKSPAVPDTDPAYEPVRRFLNQHQHSVLVSESVRDLDMMFGRADHTMYLICEGKARADVGV